MNLEENIKRMELELANMKKQLKEQNKLELKNNNGYLLQHDGISTHFDVVSTNSVTRGAFRETKELAEIADKNMVTRNLLEAYVHKLQGNGDGINSITQTHKGFFVRSIYNTGSPVGAVLMEEETAKILCKALNTGEIEL